jgi:hypothetical protein
MNTLRAALVSALLLGLAVGGAAAGSLADSPGFVDLEWIEIPESAAEIQDIDLSPVLLDMAKKAEEDDPAFAQALAMVHSIRVKAWSLDEGGDDVAAAAVEKITAHLKKNDWKRLIYVKDDEETVAVSTRYDGEDLVGLMLVAFEPGDSVAFVNVLGDLDLATLMRLASQIDSDSIENMLEGLDDHEGIEIHDHDDDDKGDI